MRIVLTGTPGTGKSSLAEALAKKTKTPRLDVKKLIERKKIYRIKTGEKEKTVNQAALQKALASWFSLHPDGIAESHLLCEFPLAVDRVVVLRCDPDVLEKRLEKRTYAKTKIRDNLECEALDYCLIHAEENYPKKSILQVDTTRRVSLALLEKRIKTKTSDAVNWSTWLEKNV